LSPGIGLHHNWHNDMVQNRRVAMSINLEPEPYEGGVLQIRRRESGEILAQVENVGAGDAILFRIDGMLQHCATEVTAGVKTAFAGWFRSGPTLRDELAHFASPHGA
jgi:predicted 2-oxoglutarate/Fe(II)-dependent dioxygenase YbiX